MAISAQQLTIYLYSAHRAVIFAIAQLSCNTTARLCLPVSPQNQRLLKQATVISGKPLISEKAKSLTARLMTYMFDGVLRDSVLYSNANSFADLCERNETVVSDNSLTHSLVDHRR